MSITESYDPSNLRILGRTAGAYGEVQRHLSYCQNCRTVFDAAALTLEVYFDREVEHVPASLRSRVAQPVIPLTLKDKHPLYKFQN